jgi:Fe-S-cluster-containing dehydrogenase component
VGLTQRLPKCVTGCPEKAIEVKEVEESLEKNIFFIGEHLAVHTRKWSKEDIQLSKKR